MTVHWSPAGGRPARPTAIAVVVGALTLACAACFSSPPASAGRPEPRNQPGVHSITPVTYRWSSENLYCQKAFRGSGPSP